MTPRAARRPTQEDVQDSFRKADIKFRQGKTLHGQGRFDEAIAYLEEAVRIRKDKGDYFLLLAMASRSSRPTSRRPSRIS